MNADTILSNARAQVLVRHPAPPEEDALLLQIDPAHWEALLLAPLRARSAKFLAHAQGWRQEASAHAAAGGATSPLAGRTDRDSLVREIVLFTEMVELLDLLWQSVEPIPGRQAGLVHESAPMEDRLRLRQKLRDASALARDIEERLAHASSPLS